MKYLLLAMLLALPAASFAQDAAPLEISAAHSLEWDRVAKTYTARQKARARQDDLDVTADVLTAHYGDTGGSTDIRRIVARGHVVLSSPPYKAYGAEAVYTLQNEHAVLTGGDLRLETPREKLTAQDRIEFFGLEERLTATGGATAVQGENTLKADTISGYFKEDAQGKLALERMEADKNVVITTAKETVHGDHGIYHVLQEQAVLTGAVKIYQGENWLEGTRAEVDLKTGISKLFAADKAETEGRVKGVFYPDNSKQ